jgi:hypothetical protein
MVSSDALPRQACVVTVGPRVPLLGGALDAPLHCPPQQPQLEHRPGSAHPPSSVIGSLPELDRAIQLFKRGDDELALRGVTSDLVTDMCMYCHGIIGVSPHDYGRALLWQICPTHAVLVTYRLGVTAAR